MGKRALLKIGYACNNRCVFCHAAPHRFRRALTAAEILECACDARKLGADMIILSGGEPTIRKDLLSILNGIRKLGLGFGLCTNGRMLAYESLSRQLAEAGLTYLYFSLHGHTAEIHDRLVGTSAFEQTLQGIQNASGAVSEVIVNVVVTRPNVGHLKQIVDRLAPLGRIRIKFSLLEPKGEALDHEQDLWPAPLQAGEAACAAIRYGLERYASPAPSFGLDGFPPCLIPGFTEYDSGLEADSIFWMREAFETQYHPVDWGERLQGRVCVDCSLTGVCPGLYSAYLQNGRRPILVPQTRRISNSATYLLQAFQARDPRPSCPPGAPELSALDPSRTLFVLGPENLAVYSTASSDFSDAELNTMKFCNGQVYRLRSGLEPNAAFDFRAGLCKLSLSRPCRQCPALPTCPGAYEDTADDTFALADGRILRMLSSLRGRVCDIGCGEEPARAEFWRERVAAGAVDYIGIDPRAQLTDHSLRIVRQPVGRCKIEASSLNAALMIRSANHVENFSATLRLLEEWVCPGGDVILSDNVAFVLATDRPPGPGEFEHFRNDASYDVLKRIAGMRFEVLEHVPVVPEGPNEWILRLRRT